jgi:hypothetical protein
LLPELYIFRLAAHPGEGLLTQTDSRRSGSAAGTGLHAPEEIFLARLGAASATAYDAFERHPQGIVARVSPDEVAWENGPS